MAFCAVKVFLNSVKFLQPFETFIKGLLPLSSLVKCSERTGDVALALAVVPNANAE